ncbi:Opi1-domain-containing protein [Viridothelium virens]|uniref:Opi1-domain-containing protein n=1 Tax=Viridothelium virens TaxID=1048519 RepID=A0A6A6HDG5_VIRVR|nr:Opi1-domain-containing protein [Viridothelium virens]
MEVEREKPPSYSSHDPNTLNLPSVPQAPPPNSDVSVLDFRNAHSSSQDNANIPILNASYHPDAFKGPLALEQHYSPSISSRTTTMHQHPASEAMSPRSIMSLDEAPGRASSVSMDDPDVRMAAEALSGLGNPDLMRSPSSQHSRGSLHTASSPSNTQQAEEEPLLTLLADTHPWLGTTINGSLTAYTTTKSYSPRFIRHGAEFVERNIGSPLSNTVGSVGRRTGVEGGLRRYLGGRQAGEPDADEASSNNASKRRKIMSHSGEIDIEQGLPSSTAYRDVSRRDSQSTTGEPLPAYDDNRAPQYDERMAVTSLPPSQQSQRNHGWRTQMFISTSGLGAALSEKSLNSLRYCLTMLRGATEHVGTLMQALRKVLEDYEQSNSGDTAPSPNEKMALTEQRDAKDAEAQRIADRIKSISDDIWKTLKTVVSNISRYTGGALPDNAGRLVRSQLMSVPQRWRIATQSTAHSPETRSETSRGGNRMLAFAKEGIDMMEQVSTILTNVVINAEKWLDSFGRKKSSESDAHVELSVNNQAAMDTKDSGRLSTPSIEQILDQEKSTGG